mmetsp:Transcript_26091/g.60224  ORF Transcript_26091/g.60224 Transcript_26091/m.60224 type:complete len:205 (-) Transcript_26091:44-658(-)
MSLTRGRLNRARPGFLLNLPYAAAKVLQRSAPQRRMRIGQRRSAVGGRPPSARSWRRSHKMPTWRRSSKRSSPAAPWQQGHRHRVQPPMPRRLGSAATRVCVLRGTKPPAPASPRWGRRPGSQRACLRRRRRPMPPRLPLPRSGASHRSCPPRGPARRPRRPRRRGPRGMERRPPAPPRAGGVQERASAPSAASPRGGRGRRGW